MKASVRPWMAIFLIVLMVGLPTRAFAFLGIGDVVHDPTTFIQTMKTAINTANQLQQQIRQTQYIFDQLKYAKMNAETLDPTSLAELQGAYYQMDSLYRQSKYIGTQWGVVGHQFDTAYEKYDPKVHDNQTYEKKLQTWEKQTDDSIRTAMVSHGVLDKYKGREIQLMKVLKASRSAKGQLQAIQAGNEISALMMKQMMELTTIIIADSRSRLSYMQEERLTQDATKKQKKAKRMMRDYGKKENPEPTHKRALTPIKE